MSVLNKNGYHDQIAMKKALLKDAEATIRELSETLTTESDVTDLSRIAVQLNALFDQRAFLTDSRKANSALIGKARKRGDDYLALVHESKEFTKKLEHVNSQVDMLIDEIVKLKSVGTATCNSETHDQLIEGSENSTCTGPSQFLPIVLAKSTRQIDLSVSSTDDEERWNEYVASNTHATHYHQYQWRGIIERNFSKTPGYFVAENSNEEIVGVAASVHMNSRIFGSFMLSMPFLIYGGPIADDQQASRMLANHISTVADLKGCSHTELRETQPRKDWHGTLGKVSMVLELPHSRERLNKTLGSKLRAQVKRAAKEQPEFLLGNSELIPEFHTVFSRKMRDLGTPVYAMGFFQDIASTFPRSTHVAVVRLRGKPVAAAFLISYRDTLEIPWAASNREFDRLGMNMFMYHSILEEAVIRRFKYFDFGRSTRGETTWSFKKQWGAQERQLYWHYQAKGTPYDPGPGGASAKFTLAVGIWKKLPLWVTNRIGPIVAKQLPW